MSLDRIYTFKSYECPFCSEGLGQDDRSKNGTSDCTHSFSSTDYNAYLQGITEYGLMVKQFKKIARKMRTVINKNYRVRNDSHKN